MKCSGKSTPQKVIYFYISSKKGSPELSIYLNGAGVYITDRAVNHKRYIQ